MKKTAPYNENSRVKIPAILHLIRLGYTYLPLKNQTWDKSCNIFTALFSQALARLNPQATADELQRYQDELILDLRNEDLGKAFFDKLTAATPYKLIDFDNPDNNSWHIVTELTYRGEQDEFRPDITLLINGLPLVFVEVKKPMNKDGLAAEFGRMAYRCQNRKFASFFNITQLMIFSNNQEYADGQGQSNQGAFYATSSYTKPIFNYFREEHDFNEICPLAELAESQIDEVLTDTNLQAIKASPEFATNCNPLSPTHKILTSLTSRERLLFLLRFGLVYVKKSHWQKHIMRYPQLFATQAIARHLSKRHKKGIIWHTQGSGKTALAFYNVRFLSEFYRKQGILPKFYFVVDRLDLAEQAKSEFTARGLAVQTIASREAFAQEIKSAQLVQNDLGKMEITVVNIHKFNADDDVKPNNNYALPIQRIYFLDEVHRSYNPTGSFLSNLMLSDTNAIHIGLTGTPLLTKKQNGYSSRDLFGGYIHQYYYNASIADGYTLRLIREAIRTEYKDKLNQAIADIQVKLGSFSLSEIYQHDNFITPMLDYIVGDFVESRKILNDATIGAMVVCDSNEQARKLFALFNDKYATTDFQAALILHDEGDKTYRADLVDEFKNGKIDLLFVNNMLLTGFDAPRLKKLYLGRMIKDHNLLQTLTRVNRPYKEFQYGYVVDFADISKEFDKTNLAYWQELQQELGSEFEHYNKLFKSDEEIKAELDDLTEKLFLFDCDNLEVFTQQLSEIAELDKLRPLAKALQNAKELYQLLRQHQDIDALAQWDFERFAALHRLVNERLAQIHLQQQLANKDDNRDLLQQALEEIVFGFKSDGKAELKLADDLKAALKRAREGLGSNFDPKDPEFVSLKDELMRLFSKGDLLETSQDVMNTHLIDVAELIKKITALNAENDRIKQKYAGDEKYCRVHKRLKALWGYSDSQLVNYLLPIKQQSDDKVLNQAQLLLNNEVFFSRELGQILFQQKQQTLPEISLEQVKLANGLIMNEYLQQISETRLWN